MCSETDTIFCAFYTGGTPDFISCQERSQLARSRQHNAMLAEEEEHLHYITVDN